MVSIYLVTEFATVVKIRMCTSTYHTASVQLSAKCTAGAYSRVVFDGRIKIVGNAPTVKLLRKLLLFVLYEEDIWTLPTTGWCDFIV